MGGAAMTMQKFTVEFSTESVKIIDNLKERLDKKSRAEVLRIALLLLKFLVEQRDKGFDISFLAEREGEPAKIVKALELVR
jgi:hypothetical protein